MKEHHVFYEPGYNGTVTSTQKWANDFGPALVSDLKYKTVSNATTSTLYSMNPATMEPSSMPNYGPENSDPPY